MHSFFNKIVFVFFMTTIFINCGSLIYKDFYVESFSHTQDFIQIKFSQEINSKSLINAFSFLKDDIEEEGNFEFTKKTLTFFPANKVEKNHLYKITISTEAESNTGVSLTNSFSKLFSTKESEKEPLIIDFQINNNFISFQFNSPIDQSSFENSFSVEPKINYIQKWSENFDFVKLEFTQPLNNNSKYIIELSQELKNIYNNNMKDIFNYYFEYNIDLIPATYSVYEKTNTNEKKLLIPNNINKNINTKSSFEIAFDKEIKMETLNSNINFMPPLNYEIQKDNITNKKTTIILKDTPNYNSEYKLYIKDSITDINSNKLKESSFILNFNNEENKNISFLGGIIDLKNDLIKFDKNTIYQDITFNVADFPTISNTQDAEEKEITIILIFELSKNSSSLSKYSFIDNFNISTTQKCISIIPTNIKIISKSTFLEQDEYKKLRSTLEENFSTLDLTSKNFSVVLQKANIQNYENPGLIKFNIKKELQDNIGNNLDSNILITFNKN